VSQIDQEGFLPLAGYNEEVECLVSFCEENFDPAWSANAGDPNFDDPRGCLDALCEDDAFCRKMFLTWEGNPDYYLLPDEVSNCKEPWLHCYDDAGIVPHPPAICEGASIGDPCAPPKVQAGQIECNLERQFCEDLMALSLQLLKEIKELKWLTPDYIVDASLDPWVNPPLAYELQHQGLEEELASGAMRPAEFKEAMRNLYSHPEAMSALYHRDPEAFVAVLGWQGFESIAGPGIRDVVPLDLRSTELSDDAQATLQSVELLESVDPFFEFEALGAALVQLERNLSPAEFDLLIDSLLVAPSALEAMGLMEEAGL
jgi:hypothetical protein